MQYLEAEQERNKGYIIHFDNNELAHYGVKGMKWRKRKSIKKTLPTAKRNIKLEKKILDKRARNIENQMYKDLNSEKKMKKTYKVGSTSIWLNQDSSGFQTGVNPSGKGYHQRIAQKIIKKAADRHVTYVKNNKGVINRGKNMVKKLLNSIFD